jgi:hypothetical protein
MSRSAHIPWFNPREMDDATVLQLNTGRTALLRQLFASVHERLAHPGVLSHWLLTGSRGAGKSFFLRLVQASFDAEFAGQARFVLLPEEHRNIYSAHELLAEIERMLHAGQGDTGAAPAWRVKEPDAAWASALASLLQAFPEPLLVVGVENFDELLAQAFSDDTDNARLRHLMSNQPRLMLVATAVQGTFDENYGQRLFRQFEHHPIPPWDASDHRDYLTRRASRASKAITPQQLARIDAYSHYTGGNARAAAVLAGAILEDNDPLHVAGDLDAAIEKMSDYYRALIDRVPPKSRKLLDALIRGGEPASQSEIAQRTGAQQNEISRAFGWLVDQGYVGESRLPGAKSKQYRVHDRLLVQFYRMRSVTPGQRSKLALMADLLADTLLFKDKWAFAHRYVNEGQSPEAHTLAELALRERMVDWMQLPEALQTTEKLCELGKAWEVWDQIANVPLSERYEEVLRRYPTDADLRRALEAAIPLAAAINREGFSCSVLVPELMATPLFSPVFKFIFLTLLLSQGATKHDPAPVLEFTQKPRALEATLDTTIPSEVQALRADLELSLLYPRTVSLDHLSRSSFEVLTRLQKPQTEVVADWAAQAALAWLNVGKIERATRSLTNCIQAMSKLVEQEKPQSLLSVGEHLSKELLNFPSGVQALIHGYMGFAREQLGESAEAYQLFMQAHAECLIAGVTSFAAFCLGWAARHTYAISGLDAAWTLLDEHLHAVAEHADNAIRSLGNAVADVCQHQGEAAGFALGAALLDGLAVRPHLVSETVLRALFINMVDKGVPHGLLRDLLDEWPHLFDHQAHPSLSDLNRLLSDWLDDLDTPPAQRETRRLTLDPDLATTLTALAANLSQSTQQKLGLAPPTPGTP